MRKLLMILAVALSATAFSQVQREDGTWYDDQLTFHVVKEQVVKFGEITICIWHKGNEMCVENLFTTYEVLVYDANDEEIWTSLWTGMYPDIKFEKELPTAAYVIIRAKRDYVKNILTGNKIYTDGMMELKYDLR